MPDTVNVVSLVTSSLDEVPLSVAMAVIATAAVGATVLNIAGKWPMSCAGIARRVGQPGRHVERALALGRDRQEPAPSPSRRPPMSAARSVSVTIRSAPGDGQHVTATAPVP